MSVVTLEEAAPKHEHLHPDVRKIAELPNKERIKWIAEERWISHPHAEKILSRLDELYGWPVRLRMPNMLIVGPTNNGKTTLVHRFINARSPAVMPYDQDIKPLVYTRMFPKPTVEMIYGYILTAINVPYKPTARMSVLQPLAISMLRKVQTRMLFVDEVQEIQNAPPRVQRDILSLFKFLGNELQIPIIGIGTEEAAQALSIDPQLANRFTPYALPKWNDPKFLAKLLVSFAYLIPLRKPSRLADEKILKLVANLTDGSIGDITELIEKAAGYAIASGQECITPETLLHCGYESSSERRHEVDLMRTGS